MIDTETETKINSNTIIVTPTVITSDNYKQEVVGDITTVPHETTMKVITTDEENKTTIEIPTVTIEFQEDQLDFVKKMLDSKKTIPIVQNRRRPDGKRFEVGQIFPTTWGDEIIVTQVVYCILPIQLPTWRTMNPDEKETLLTDIVHNGIDNLCYISFKKYNKQSL